MKRNITICPSVLSADFAHLAKEVQRAEASGADRLHVDIMDGLFVPNLSMGPAIVAAINRSTNLFLHVHLMIYSPFSFVEQFCSAGADQISFHIEATEDVSDVIEFIRRCGKKVAIAISPSTPISLVQPYLDDIDELVVMTVEPGFGGQPFLKKSVQRIKDLVSLLQCVGRTIPIAVDGGIDVETAKLCYDAGASIFIAGSHLFGAQHMEKAIEEMRSIGTS